MVRRPRRIAIFATLAAAVSLFGSTFALGSTGNSGNAAAQGPPAHVASAFGRANLAGQETFVHVTVAGVSAASAQAAARAELGRRGAVPVESAEYTKNGTWKQFGDNDSGNDQVVLHYNPANRPAGVGDYTAAIGGTTPSWNNVDSSSFAFSWGSNTNQCPSLVEECGSQVFNGANETGWLDLGDEVNGSITLGVTWFNFRTRGGPFAAPQETDMVLSSNQAIHWDSTGTGGWLDIDSLTVAAHEFGHMAGLGHSGDQLALMYPSYQDARLTLLGTDDIAGISALYPAADGGSGSTGDVPGYCKKHPERAGCP